MPRLRIDTAILCCLSLLMLSLAWFAPYTETNYVRNMEEIKRSGKLIVLTQNNPSTYFTDRDGRESGPEYKLIRAFANTIGVTPYFITKISVSELLEAVASGEGDIAAAGLSVTEQRSQRFLFSKSYQQVSQQVVCRRGGARPKKVAHLPGINLVVISGSSYEERLKELKVDYPELSWVVTQGVSAEQLLERVWKREIECTVMDSNIVAINQRYFPELKVRFSLGEPDNLAWVMPKSAKSLQAEVNKWFDSQPAKKKIKRVQERYYGHVSLFDYVDTTAFIRRIESHYPKYQVLFKMAAQTYGLSEVLLAAQAYQESHWNPKAKSPTGVRGIMMLTLVTAKSMGVKSRLNVEQSIMGGAKYLAKLKSKLAKNIEEPDLTWFALAAYNVGLAHIRDAQALARHFGDSPYRWHDVKKTLPLLSDPNYYKFLKYGYARGSEPVRYVQQIRQYEQILRQFLEQQKEKEKKLIKKEYAPIEFMLL